MSTADCVDIASSSTDMHHIPFDVSNTEDPLINIPVDDHHLSTNLLPSSCSPSTASKYNFENDSAWINAYYTRNIPHTHIYYNREDLVSLPESVRCALEAAVHSEHAQRDWVADKLRSSWETVEKMIETNRERDVTLDRVLNVALEAYSKTLLIKDFEEDRISVGEGNRHSSKIVSGEEREGVFTFWDDKRFRHHFGVTSILDEIPVDEEGCPYQSDEGYQRSFGILSGTSDHTGAKKSEDMSMSPVEELALIEGRIPIPMSQLNDDVALRRRIRRSDRKDGITLKDSLLIRPEDTHKTMVGYRGYTPHHFAPLRYCFSHILQHRDKYPKQMTKLLNIIQSSLGHLELLERRMESCAFNIPLYEPFRCIALSICRDLTSTSSSIKLADDFKKEHQEIFTCLLSILKALLVQHYELDEDEGMRQRMTEKKANLGSCMWGILNTELQCRKELHHRTLRLIEDTIAAEKVHMERTNSLVSKCHVDVDEILAQLEEEACAIVEAVQKIADKVVKVIEDAKEAYNSDRKKLLDQHKESSYRMNSSRNEQEKILRKIRELYKSLGKEQSRHHDAYCDVLSSQLHLTKMEKCYEVFTEVAARRHEAMCEAVRSCNSLKDIFTDTKVVCGDILREMDLHVSKEASVEKVMKYDAAQIAAENALEWRRSLGDLACLYSKQHDDVVKRNESWQLDFLLSNRRQTVFQNLSEMRDEVSQLDTEWRKMKEKYFEPFEISVPPLLSEVDERLEVLRARYVLVELECNREYLRIKKKEAIQWSTVHQNPSSLLSLFSPSEYSSLYPLVTDNIVLSTNADGGAGENSDIVSSNINTTDAAPSNRLPSPPHSHHPERRGPSIDSIIENNTTNECKASPTITSNAIKTVDTVYSRRMLLTTGALRDPTLRPKVSLPVIDNFEMEMDRLHREHAAGKKRASFSKSLPSVSRGNTHLNFIEPKGTSRVCVRDYDLDQLNKSRDLHISHVIRLTSADTALLIPPKVCTSPPRSHIPKEFTQSVERDQREIYHQNQTKVNVSQSRELEVVSGYNGDETPHVIPPRVPRPPLRDAH